MFIRIHHESSFVSMAGAGGKWINFLLYNDLTIALHFDLIHGYIHSPRFCRYSGQYSSH
jgi:hypothetical protein